MEKNTILWADDDADDLQLMRDILVKSDRDFDIVEVHNGKEAINYLESSLQEGTLPCLIILDINMPVLDGKETLSLIKKSEPLRAIPVVVFSTSESKLDKIFCQRLGSEMITKPPSFSSLEATIMRMLGFCSQ